MPCALRLALIWLLSLAMPFQNVMAAGAAACAQRHHLQTAAPAQMAHHGHDAHGTIAAAAAHDHSSVGAADQASGDGDASACVLCAGCCTGGVLPSAPIPDLSLPTAHFEPPRTPCGTLDVVPARLERPPRSTAS
jgi:hypothetical protein